MSSGVVRVLLADAQALFRDAVRMALDSEPDVHVVAEARDGTRAVSEAECTEPAVVLLDAHLPGMDCIEAARTIRQRVPRCGVVVVGGREDVSLLEQALEVGVRGFVTKASPMSELVGAIRAVHRGETLVPPCILGDLLGGLMRQRNEKVDAFRRVSRLTRRQRDVLRLLADGSDTEAIAEALIISPQTARTHIQNMVGKLGFHSRLEAAAFARQTGIVEELLRSDAWIQPSPSAVRDASGRP